MVKRNADGSLKVIGQMPDDDWLREDPPEVRRAMIAKQEELDRGLTEEELEEIRAQFAG